MKPIDLRDATFAGLSREFLTGARLTLYRDLLERGPSTTRALAERTGISIFTVRPRVTELAQIGLVKLGEAAGREGIYCAIQENDWAPLGVGHQMSLI